MSRTSPPRRRTRIIAYLTLCAFAMSACASDGPVAPSPHVTPIDGEVLFRGLVFGEGAVARTFPEIWGGKQIDDPSWTAEQREAVVKTKTALVADMRTADPQFFDRYAAALQSGDRLRIERTLDESATLFQQVAAARLSTQGAGQRDATGTCLAGIVAVFVVAVATINVAGALNFVVAANFAVAANLVYNQNAFWGGGGGPKPGPAPQQLEREQQQLARDEIVNMLALRLALQ